MEVKVSVVTLVKSAEVSVLFSGKVCGICFHIVDRKWTAKRTNVAF